MASKKQYPNLEPKTPNAKGYFGKNPFDTVYDMKLFSFRCPEFIFSICWKDWLCHFKNINRNVCLPTPEELENVLWEFSQQGYIEKLFAMPMVEFTLCHGVDCLASVHYAGNVVIVSPQVSFYCHQLVKAYYNFYKNFNSQNYIING